MGKKHAGRAREKHALQAVTAMLFLLATVVVPASRAEAQTAVPLPAEPQCSETTPLGCLRSDEGISLTSAGTLGQTSTFTLDLDLSIPPCANVDASNCYFRIDDPRVACYNIPYSDVEELTPCVYFGLGEFFLRNSETPGAFRTPAGSQCDSRFNPNYYTGGDATVPGSAWSERSQDHLTCEGGWVFSRPVPGLYAPTWLKVSQSVGYCTETIADGCEETTVVAETWVEVTGDYIPPELEVACELGPTNPLREPWMLTAAITERALTGSGRNIYHRLLRSDYTLSEGLVEVEGTGTYRPEFEATVVGTQRVEFSTRPIGWDFSVNASCSHEVTTVDPTGGGGDGNECDGELVTVWLSEGQRPTEGDDVIMGTDGADTIDGLGGNDIICAGDGNDWVQGGAGHDRIFGGDGNDRLFGAQGFDEIHGGAGDDTIHGNRGNDELYGDEGADKIFGYAHDDTIHGGDGNDRLHGNFGNDSIDGGAGNDRIFGYGDDDLLSGGSGDDLIGGNRGDDSIDGGSGNDTLYGSDGDDTVNGGPGSDRVEGNSLDDILDGGPGNDDLDGGIGVDQCNGNEGADTAARCETVTSIP